MLRIRLEMLEINKDHQEPRRTPKHKTIFKEKPNTKPCKSSLQSNFTSRETYKYYAGQQPHGLVPSIGMNVMSDFVDKAKICDKYLKLSDIDVEFIATCAGVKNNPLNPDRAIIRYQFMEILVREAFHQYYKSHRVQTRLEAVELFFYDMKFFNSFDCHAWRAEKLWNDDCNRILRRYEQPIYFLYQIYSGKHSKPGMRKSVSIEEFITMI